MTVKREWENSKGTVLDDGAHARHCLIGPELPCEVLGRTRRWQRCQASRRNDEGIRVDENDGSCGPRVEIAVGCRGMNERRSVGRVDGSPCGQGGGGYMDEWGRRENE